VYVRRRIGGVKVGEYLSYLQLVTTLKKYRNIAFAAKLIALTPTYFYMKKYPADPAKNGFCYSSSRLDTYFSRPSGGWLDTYINKASLQAIRPAVSLTSLLLLAFWEVRTSRTTHQNNTSEQHIRTIHNTLIFTAFYTSTDCVPPQSR